MISRKQHTSPREVFGYSSFSPRAFVASRSDPGSINSQITPHNRRNRYFPNYPDLAFFLDMLWGSPHPLVLQFKKLQGDVMRFDILVHNSDDLLDSNCFEQLLRLCASGIVAYAGASPSCCEYSRLKLLPNGPPALRTPHHMDGIPGISGSDLLKVQNSSLMLHRCIQCLHLTIASGGHGHLEQPKSAMSWDEPMTREFISQHNCACISMAACGFGRDWHKFWLFASTFYALSRMACSCIHPANSHQPIAGVRTPTGHYLSRETAEYPPALADQFAQIILPLLTDRGHEVDISNFEKHLPIKDVTSPPFVRQDGAGFPSKGDWSGPHNFEDCFQTLRKNFFQSILSARLDQILLRAFNEQQAEPPFSDEQLQPFKRFLDEFLLAQGIQPDWSIPPDQQLCLHILQKLCQCMQDPDNDLFPYLISGVPLGINEEILPSKCFPLNPTDTPMIPLYCQSITPTGNPLRTIRLQSKTSSTKKLMLDGWSYSMGPWKRPSFISGMD